MSRILDLLKSNWLTMTCVAAIAVSLASFYWPTHAQGQAFVREVKGRTKDLGRIGNLMQTPTQIPPNNENDPPRPIQLAINQPAIDKLEGVFTRLADQYAGIYQEATELNRAGHTVMLEGLFPKPVNAARPFAARRAYAQVLTALYQSLNASLPPSQEDVDKLLAETSRKFRRRYNLPDELSGAERAQLTREQASALIKFYKQAARRLHLYSQPVVLDLSTGEWKPGPFQVGEWAKDPSPRIDDIWEGQMQLWIQQDIVHALRLANNMDDPNASVVAAPVKRLVEMIVKPGYIGLDNRRSGARPSAPPDPKELIKSLRDLTSKRLPDNFAVSPTGRTSNPIYDVRHAVLKVVADSQQIPRLINAINQVNFMTVIGISLRNVDEYADFRKGFFYGDKVDVFEVVLEIETLWMRSWLAGDLEEKDAADANRRYDEGLIPDGIRRSLGLPTRGSIVATP